MSDLVEVCKQSATSLHQSFKKETGYTFKEIILLGTTAANPGLLNNYTYMFLATGGVKTSAQLLDDNEEINIIAEPLGKARQMLAENKIVQSMHALCMFYAFKFLDKN